jgi:hypothetical protein
MRYFKEVVRYNFRTHNFLHAWTGIKLGGFMLLNGKSYGVPNDSDASIGEEEEDISKEDEYADAEDDGFIKIW